MSKARESIYFSKRSAAALLSLGLFLSACASEPTWELNSPANFGGQTGETNPTDNEFDHPIDQACSPGNSGFEDFSVVVDGAEAFNVLFILDDSSSMGPLIQKVVNQTQNFIQSLLDATVDGSSLRVGLIFDSTRAGFSSFPLVNGSRNPFQSVLVNGSQVSHFEQQTASKWADRAFYQVFGRADRAQVFPASIPADRPHTGSSIGPETCSDLGSYYRPRAYPYTQETGWWQWMFHNVWNYSPCVARVKNERLEDHFISGAPLNVVVLSDDDLNISFDRPGFDPADNTKRSYPEIADLMFRDLVSELDSTYHYHSIINLDKQRIIDLNYNAQEVGVAHWALSYASGGSVFDIQEEDYEPIFQQLVQEIIYASQNRVLNCSAVPSTIKVYRNEILMPETSYLFNAAEKRIQFQPEFFEGLPSGQTLSVRVSYQAL